MKTKIKSQRLPLAFKNRTAFLSVRLTEEEFKKLEEFAAKVPGRSVAQVTREKIADIIRVSHTPKISMNGRSVHEVRREPKAPVKRTRKAGSRRRAAKNRSRSKH